jgi:hypothetical protein
MLMVKKISLILVFSLIPLSLFAEQWDGFITYRRALVPGVSIVQADDTTTILYRRKPIKIYQNKEFATELLPHGPNEDPDCYNSLRRDIPSTRAKNIIGKDYLRSCLVLDSKLFRGKYILFYAPSIEGNRVSIYDIRAKKFYHSIINTALSVEITPDRGLVFLTSNRQSPCERSIIYFKNGATKKLYDDCRLTQLSTPLISLQSLRLSENSVGATYFPYRTSGYDTFLDTTKSENIVLPLPFLTAPVLTPRTPQSLTGLLVPSIR